MSFNFGFFLLYNIIFWNIWGSFNDTFDDVSILITCNVYYISTQNLYACLCIID